MHFAVPAVGGCNCGLLRYRVTKEPLTSYICHFHRCQTRTGSAFSMSIVFPATGLHIEKGQPVKTERALANGSKNCSYVCGQCYSRLYTQRDGSPTINLRAGTLDENQTEGFPFYDVGWSLQHELAFYVLAALLVPNVGLVGLSIFLCVGAVADQILTLPWFLHQYGSYYPNFLAGIVAFAANGYTKRFGVWLPIAVGIGLLALFTQTAGQLAFPVALFFLLVGFVNIEFDERFLAKKFGVLLGDASYSIYLLHPLVFYTVYWRLQPPLPPLWSQEILRFGSIIVVCLLAIASWRLFESPMIELGNALVGRIKRPRVECAQTSSE